mmetsp:Transcript_37667/g.69611  ORF Transcript_37667/g.69611 Transcript_37667/m.69611 type:complete len:676 (-) Transcript_37667:89-2116(-)
MPFGVYGWNVVAPCDIWPANGCWVGLKPWPAAVESRYHRRRKKLSAVALLAIPWHFGSLCMALSNFDSEKGSIPELACLALGFTAGIASCIAVLSILCSTDMIRSRQWTYYLWMLAVIFMATRQLFFPMPHIGVILLRVAIHMIGSALLHGQVSVLLVLAAQFPFATSFAFGKVYAGKKIALHMDMVAVAISVTILAIFCTAPLLEKHKAKAVHSQDFTNVMPSGGAAQAGSKYTGSQPEAQQGQPASVSGGSQPEAQSIGLDCRSIRCDRTGEQEVGILQQILELEMHRASEIHAPSKPSGDKVVQAGEMTSAGCCSSDKVGLGELHTGATQQASDHKQQELGNKVVQDVEITSAGRSSTDQIHIRELDIGTIDQTSNLMQMSSARHVHPSAQQLADKVGQVGDIKSAGNGSSDRAKGRDLDAATNQKAPMRRHVLVPTLDSIPSVQSSEPSGLASQLCKQYVHGAMFDVFGTSSASNAARSHDEPCYSSHSTEDGLMAPALPCEPSFSWHNASIFSGDAASVYSAPLGRGRIENWCHAAQLFFQQDLPAQERREISSGVLNVVDQTSHQCRLMYTPGEADFDLGMQLLEQRDWSSEMLLDWILTAMDPAYMPKTQELALSIAILLSSLLEPIVGPSARLDAADPFATAFEEVTMTTTTSAVTQTPFSSQDQSM